jgi:L-fuconolactonase
MPSRIVDIHPHIISTDTDKYPRAPLYGNQSGWSQERPTSAEQMLAAMDEAGIAKSAIVQASTCYGFDNSLVADAVARYPERFTGVFAVDMLADDAAERIRYWVGRQLTGLRLFTSGSTIVGQAPGLADPKSFAGWDAAVELGLPVVVQMRTAGMPKLRVLLDRYPGATIIIDHMFNTPLDDGPPYANAEPLFELVRFPNVVLKLTSVIIKQSRQGKATPESYFKRVVSEFGASRIAWGSNFPASVGTLPELLADAESALAFTSSEDKEWIFHGTSEKLYPALK